VVIAVELVIASVFWAFTAGCNNGLDVTSIVIAIVKYNPVAAKYQMSLDFLS
jgi:hypothetical protein